MLAQFIEFVNRQPADREVNHATWNSCAVGDFAREVLNHEIAIPLSVKNGDAWDRDFSVLYTDKVLVQLHVEAGSCQELIAERYGCALLEEAGIFDELAELSGRGTYAEVQDIVAEYQPG